MDSIWEFLADNPLMSSNSQRVVDALQRAYEAAYNGLKEDQELHVEHHTPAGEILRLGRLKLDPNVNAWLLDGQSKHTGEWCRVFVPVSATHIVMRLVTVEEGGEPERKKIGFNVSEEEAKS